MDAPTLPRPSYAPMPSRLTPRDLAGLLRNGAVS